MVSLDTLHILCPCWSPGFFYTCETLYLKPGRVVPTERVLLIIRRLIPQGTVDYNLGGPDRLACPKALDPNHCRQPNL